MALGDITVFGWNLSIELLASRTTTNNPPSAATDGIDLNSLRPAAGRPVSTTGGIYLYSTAGSGTMTVQGRVWGYVSGPNKWFPLGSGADADKGKLNEAVAGTFTTIGETTSDQLLHVEPIRNLGLLHRLYLEITSIGGTSTAVTAKLIVPLA